MMFGQNRQPASVACFFDKQLIITTKSDLTGMLLISCLCLCSSSSNNTALLQLSQHAAVL